MKKRAISTLMCLCMVSSLFTLPASAVDAGLENFQKSQVYSPGQYSDVPFSNAFSENVKAGYEYGIMQGYGSTFGVADNITRLASIIIACRLNCIYYNGFNNITDNYTGTMQEIYTGYARDHGILCDFNDISQNATRAEFAAILNSALPNAALYAINVVDDNAIPDVTMDAPYADSIYRLYRAGIINGSDKMGTFYPNSNITRGAACAISTRMCDESLRKNITLENNHTEDAHGTVTLDKWIYTTSIYEKDGTYFSKAYVTGINFSTYNGKQTLYLSCGGIRDVLKVITGALPIVPSENPYVGGEFEDKYSKVSYNGDWLVNDYGNFAVEFRNRREYSPITLDEITLSDWKFTYNGKSFTVKEDSSTNYSVYFCDGVLCYNSGGDHYAPFTYVDVNAVLKQLGLPGTVSVYEVESIGTVWTYTE